MPPGPDPRDQAVQPAEGRKRNVVELAALKLTGPAVSRSTAMLQDNDPFEYPFRVRTQRSIGLLFRFDAMGIDPLGRFDRTGDVIAGSPPGRIGANRGKELFVLVLTDDPVAAERIKHLSQLRFDDLRDMQNATDADRERVVRERISDALRDGDAPWSGSLDDILLLETLSH